SHQRGADRGGVDPDHAGLPRQFCQRRVARPVHLRGRARRRPQPARRDRRRARAWVHRQSRRGLFVTDLARRAAARHPHRGGAVAPARFVRPQRGVSRVNPVIVRYAAAGFGALVLIAVPFALTDYGDYVLSLWALTTIAAIGLNLTLGYVGQVSLGQGAFVGIGAYVTALLTTRGWPLSAAYLLAFAACFALGWGLAYPSLRVRRPFFPFITLAFGAFIFLVFRNEEWLTGGIYGINRVPRPSILGLSTTGPLGFCYFCLFNLAV